MKHIGLFEGIGGFSLAAEWMGWETIAWSEWNEFGQKVLRYHFPKAKGYGDITKTDFTIYRGQCDILTGGFPCQPYSISGKRKGKEDERHLWPEMLRAVREIQPTYVVGENVSGLINWDGGLVFDEVQTDLEAQGYEVFPYVLPACAKNAPHRRDRVWFIAYSHNARTNNGSRTNTEWQTENEGREGQPQFEHRTNGSNGITENTDTDGRGSKFGKEKSCIGKFGNAGTGNNEQLQTNDGEVGNLCDTESKGLEGQEQWHTEGQGERYRTGYLRADWNEWPTKSAICGGDDGLPRELDTITFPKWRTESIKAYGNAIVPQVAFEIFKAIMDVHCQTKC